MRHMLKGWKTILFNTLTTLTALAELQDWTQVIPDEYEIYFVFVVTLMNIILRFFTTTPVGSKW